MRFFQIVTLLALPVLLGNVLAKDEGRPKANFPETEIFLFNLDISAEQDVLTSGVNVTQHVGYDNQPYFTNNSKSFVFSRGDEYQTDVFEYHLESKNTQQLTNTDATEFSPTPTPDNKSISFVSDRSHSIWIGKRTTINKPELAQQQNHNKEPIGYYAWNYATGDIFYWSQYGFSVALVNANNQSYHFVSGHAVPSTPHVIPGSNNFSFVHRQTNGEVWIKKFDPDSKSISPIVPTVGSNSNYIWAPDGSILMIEDNALYRWTETAENGWQQIADLTKFGIQGANRIAISPDASKLAVVGVPTDVTQ